MIRLTRRDALRLAGATALGATILGGCRTGGSGNVSGGSGSSARVTLPTYIPYEGVQATLPATPEGVQPFFEAYPASPPRMTTEKPATSGAPITALASVPGAPPNPVGENPYWQELNERLGAELQLTMAPSASYPEKFSTVIAGGDVPDLAEIRFQPNLPQLLDALFADLTEHLSGDAIKDYPALANIPTFCWRSAVYNGRIYGIPQHRPNTGTPLTSRMDIRRDVGADEPVTSGDDFIELCRALTDPASNRWAMGAPVALHNFFIEMLGGPNIWREENGEFTSVHESEEAEAALEQVKAMWSEGLFHPDSFGQPGALTPNPGEVGDWLVAGRIALNYGGTSWLASAMGARTTSGDPDYEIAVIAPPKFDGGGTASKHLGTGVYALTGISGKDPDRVEELLRVVNWMAAPVGTQEQLFKRYGIEGRHYELSGTDPVATGQNPGEILLSAGYLGAPPIVSYAAGGATIARQEYEWQSEMAKNGTEIPTLGLYSDTEQNKGAELELQLNNVKAEIIQDRQPISAWRDAVANWRKSGGDAIRDEYTEALQQEGSR